MDSLKQSLGRLFASRLSTEFPIVFDYPDEFFQVVSNFCKSKENHADHGIAAEFEKARLAYPGLKRGFAVEFEALKKKHKDYKQVIELMLPAIKKEEIYHQQQISMGKFCPSYQHFKTWINQRSWETVFPESTTVAKAQTFKKA